MPSYPELLVMRHGQTVWNREGRHQGQLDSPLDQTGEAQAARLGEILAEHLGDGRPDAFVSPSGRARQTAEIALSELSLPLREDPRLMEVHFGEWQGLLDIDIRHLWPALAPELHPPFAWHFMAPGGETFGDLVVRTQAFLEDLSAPAVIFTHGITSRVLRGLWLGVGMDEMREMPGGQGVAFHLSDGRQTPLR